MLVPLDSSDNAFIILVFHGEKTVAAMRTISIAPDDSCRAGDQERGNGDGAGCMEFSKSKNYNEEAEIFKVLGHPVRLKIAAGLCAEECTVKIIWECLGLPQSTVSTGSSSARATWLPTWGICTRDRIPRSSKP